MFFWMLSNVDEIKILKHNNEWHQYLIEDGHYADKIMPFGLIYVGF